MTIRQILLGDARDVLRGLVPDGAVVITDPPWPIQSAGLYGDGGAWTAGLLREVLDVCSNARRVVIVASQLTDPRWLAEVDAERWPFVTTGWMRYVQPSYRGTRMLTANVCHVFGDHRATRGHKVIAGEMIATSNRERTPSTHPTPLLMAHARWAVGRFTNPGDLVVDPFAGSGRILRAAVESGCGALGAEKNPTYRTEASALLEQPNLLDGAWQ